MSDQAQALNRGEQFCDAQGAGFTVGVGGRVLQCHRHERAQQGQPATAELFVQNRGIGGQVAPVAQFGAGVAGVGQLIEHLVRADRLAGHALELERSPGTRGVTYAPVGHIA